MRVNARAGTPARRENPNVAEFSRLFTQQLEAEARERELGQVSGPGQEDAAKSAPLHTQEQIATECVLYGYRDKDDEWKAIDRFERISQGVVCEDYPRTDPHASPRYPSLLSSDDVVIRPRLSPDANRKSKRYAGGFHWIKVTFDSVAAADRACHFSPQSIDGCLVYCRLYQGHEPEKDAAIPAEDQRATPTLLRQAELESTDFAVDLGRTFVPRPVMDVTATTTSHQSTATVSSATAASSSTATGAETGVGIDFGIADVGEGVHQRHPSLQPQPSSEFMTHIPTVRRAALRPISEALPPQPSWIERILRSIPILNWFMGDFVGDGPMLREDGSFDYDKSNTYWRFWYVFDRIVGTDLCGLSE